jgi:hypothetical protein
MDFDNASAWVCENCGGTGFSQDNAPSCLTVEELAEAARQHTLWCDHCGESR